MKKRMALIVICVLFLSTVLSSFAFAESYWTAMEAYVNALNNSDDLGIIDAANRIAAVYSSPSDVTEYTRLASPYQNAGKACERLGRHRDAVTYYSKALRCATWLDNHGIDQKDTIRILNALIEHNEGVFEVYTQTVGEGDVPFHGAINEPDAYAGTFSGMCGNFMPESQSATLIYVQYFTEEISAYSYKLPEDNSKLVEIAWNVPNENYNDLVAVCSDTFDDYMLRNISWLASQDYKFLVRFGAEIDCWPDLDNNMDQEGKDKFTSKFKEAFIKVANAVHSLAPNCAMVFSPNYISNWVYSPDDFYPGDEYVDWVGMSSYGNLSGLSDYLQGSVDVCYSRGYYENQLMSIRHIIETYGDRKPIVISECGNCYRHPSGIQTEQHAVASLKYFYTYINMVYPQVRAIFYFNTDIKGEYFSLEASTGMGDAYAQTVAHNAGIQASLGNSDKNYVSLKNFSENTDSVSLYTYRYMPGKNCNITYTMDGSILPSESTYPYTCIFERPDIGVHTLVVTARNDADIYEKKYSFSVDDQGTIKFIEVPMQDIAVNNWAFQSVAYVLDKGIFNGTSKTTFGPNSKLTRAMLVTVIGRLEGTPENTNADTPFSDIEKGKYYTGYVAWAAENGIVNGVSATEFAPNSSITREQVATIIYRYAQFKGMDVSELADIDYYADAISVSDYAKDAIRWAKFNGIINGRTESTIVPKGTATRAEIAKIIMVFNLLYNIK